MVRFNFPIFLRGRDVATFAYPTGRRCRDAWVSACKVAGLAGKLVVACRVEQFLGIRIIR